MAIITNYATLKTAIADYLARDDLTSYIPNFVQATERELDARLNLRNEETALNISVSSGTGTVPTDFKGLRVAYVDGNPVHVLQWVTLDELYRDHPVVSGAGTPAVISREGTNFVFGPSPSDFTLKGVYYATQDSLETTDGSWYVTNHPEVLLYGSMREAALFIKDLEMYSFWDNQFERLIKVIKSQDCSEQNSMGSLVIRTA